MSRLSYDIFVSYARADNTALSNGKGWIDAFVEYLKRRHLEWAGQPLSVYFDKTEILNGDHWESHLAAHLRDSRLMLAFPSPAYLASPWCRMEWDTFLRHEHSSARGDSGIKQVHIVPLPDHPPSAEVEEWLAQIKSRQSSGFRLLDWRDDPQALEAFLRLGDAERRLDDLIEHPKNDTELRLVPFIQSIRTLDESIAERLDHVILAEIATGHGNIGRSYSDFVGRARELRSIHSALMEQKVGVIAALHGFGGQGKTALAVQYAYAYAGFYACGGRWRLGCEGRKDLAALVTELTLLVFQMDNPEFRLPEGSESRPAAERTALYLSMLRRRTEAQTKQVQTALQAAARHSPDPAIPVKPRMLVILDNVDQPGLLSAAALEPFANDRDWLEIVVTTRDDPATIGARSALASIPVDDLPIADAVALLNRLAPFNGPDDRTAAGEIARILGGMTLAVELSGGFLSQPGAPGYSAFAAAIAKDISQIDHLADIVTHDLRADARSRTIAAVMTAALAPLNPSERLILTYASFFPPDVVPLAILESLAKAALPDAFALSGGQLVLDPWRKSLAHLNARRLLVTQPVSGSAVPTAKLHRLAMDHIQRGLEDGEKDKLREATVSAVFEKAAWIETTLASAPQLCRPWLPVMIAVQDVLAAHRPAGLRLLPLFHILASLAVSFDRLDSAINLERSLLDALRALPYLTPDQQRLAAMCQVTLGDLHVRRQRKNDFDIAAQLYQSGYALHKALSDANPRNLLVLSDLGTAEGKLANFYWGRGQEGDSDLALQFYRASLASDQASVAAQPGNVTARYNLALSQERLGDFLVWNARTTAESTTHEQRKVALEKTKSAGHSVLPGGFAVGDGTSFPLPRHGDNQLLSGHSVEAETAHELYQTCVAALQALIDSHLGSASIQSALNRVQRKYDDLSRKLSRHGGTVDVLGSLQSDASRHRALLDIDPGNMSAMRELRNSQEALGKYFLSRGQPTDRDSALALFLANLKIQQSLADFNLHDGQAQRDLADSLEMVANQLAKRSNSDDHNQAVSLLTAAYDIRTKIYDENPTLPAAQLLLFIVCMDLGDILNPRQSLILPDRFKKHFGRARALYEQALELAELLMTSENPGRARAEHMIAFAERNLAEQARRADHERSSIMAHYSMRRRLETKPSEGDIRRAASLRERATAFRLLGFPEDPELSPILDALADNSTKTT